MFAAAQTSRRQLQPSDVAAGHAEPDTNAIRDVAEFDGFDLSRQQEADHHGRTSDHHERPRTTRSPTSRPTRNRRRS